MSETRRSVACDRARFWASLAPDGELSMLEQRLLEAHVARCAACASYASGVLATTDELRAAPAEAPRFQVAVHARRRLPAHARSGAISVAATVAVLLGTLAIGSQADLGQPAPAEAVQQAPLIVVAAPQDDKALVRTLRSARREQLLQSQGDDSVAVVRPGVHS